MTHTNKRVYVVVVPSLHGALSFYRDVLGLQVEPGTQPGWSFFHSIHFTIIAITCRDLRSNLTRLEIGDVAKLDELYTAMNEAGMRICKPIGDDSQKRREFGVVTADGYQVMFRAKFSNTSARAQGPPR